MLTCLWSITYMSGCCWCASRYLALASFLHRVWRSSQKDWKKTANCPVQFAVLDIWKKSRTAKKPVQTSSDCFEGHVTYPTIHIPMITAFNLGPSLSKMVEKWVWYAEIHFSSLSSSTSCHQSKLKFLMNDQLINSKCRVSGTFRPLASK